jgi:glycosyltransferase involved in cell wall biosynthesis
MMHLTLKISTRIVVLSAVLQQEVRALGFDASVIPLGVDASCFLDSQVRRDARHAGPFKLLHVASINRIKDQPTLLHALQRVLVELPGTTLDIIGVDTLNGELQRLAEALGIAAHVRFHGFLTQEAMRPFWRQADLFVLSSLHEGQCVAVCEAAAAGMPTVGTRVGILAEWAPNNLAVGVPVGDATALASEIVALLRGPSRRSRMATAAHAWATAHDADWTARQLEAIYSG